MRKWLVGSLLMVCGCGSTGDRSAHTTNLNVRDLSLERTAPQFENSNIRVSENAIVTLSNTDFQTPRRIENSVGVDVNTKSPDEVLTALAEKAARALYPDTDLKVVSLRRGRHFAYVTFQQTFANREVFGARLVVRMTQSADWSTMSSTLINPALLQSQKEDATPLASKELKSSRYLDLPHIILVEKSVWMPRLENNSNGDDELVIHPAREWSVFDTDHQMEYQVWADERSEDVLAAVNSAEGLDETELPTINPNVKIVGTIVPNAPTDTPVEQFFPFVSAIIDTDASKKIQSDALGNIAKSIFGNAKAGQITLENEFVSVVSNAKSKRTSDLDLNHLDHLEKFWIDQGPSLDERNVYYWIMQARKYLKENLKYDGMKYQLAAITNYGEQYDNAFFMPTTKSLSFGMGGKFLKNTALSRDVVIHEFGHAVTHDIYGMVQNYEFNAMNEAFSDYFAATITGDPQIGDGAMADSTGLKFLRTVENKFHYPEAFLGNRFHSDGQMFSGALWDMRKILGQKVADEMVHEARLAQAKTIHEFLLELLKIDENQDDRNPLTASKNNRVIWTAFLNHGLNSGARFSQSPPENLTLPWKRWDVPGCFNVREL